MKKMLFITAFPPNHKSGGQTFTYNTLCDLKEKYEIDLIFFKYPAHNYERIPGIRELKAIDVSYKNCFRNIRLFPAFSKRFSYKTLEYLKKIANEYDVLYFDYVQVAIYACYLKHTNIIVRCHDILGQKYARENKILCKWIMRTEEKILNKATMVLVPSKKDLYIVDELYKIKAEYTHEYLREFNIDISTQIVDKYLCFGLWSRYENINGLRCFLENVYDNNIEFFKGRLDIMGGGMSTKNINNMLKKRNIEYLGYVDDSYEKIVQYKAMIVPLLEGAGIKVKVLDAFNTGTPVVGTNIAFEGIEIDNDLINIVDEGKDYIRLLREKEDIDIERKRVLQLEFKKYYCRRKVSDVI